jgi:2,3-bisphosphoglycerate-independent phosphoglycerate mutase
MDGFGHNPDSYGNAIRAAKTPRLDEIFSKYPMTFIGASGMDVGLPDGQMGNSEVGHTNIGAGRVVYQELTRISKSITDGDFFENEAFLNAIEHAKKNGGAVHLMGLLSDGGVHSHNTHLYALVELCKKQGLDRVFIHCIMDGRDVSPTSGVGYVKELFEKLKEIGVGKIATIMGRYYGMDREKKWDRVERAYNAITKCEGVPFKCGKDLLEKSYADGVTDEFVNPSVSENAQCLKDGDSVIFFNFRPDRARQLTRAIIDPDFDGFKRDMLKDLYYVCMTQYDATMPNVDVAFKPDRIESPIGAVVSAKGMKQLRIAEYTKYAHVTFFLNGGEETVYEGEDRILIDSPNVATYDLKPEMSAFEVADTVVKKIRSGEYDFVVINFANCDMVGHSGVMEAAVKAVEAVDACVGKVYDAVMAMNGVMVLTADHGNAEKMYEEDGSPFTAHTTNPVPFVVIGYNCLLKDGVGRLCDISPTMLQLMGIEKPATMTGESLIKPLK